MLVLVAVADPLTLELPSSPSTVAGELVIPIDSCTCVAPCSCRRSWFGIASGGTTFTAIVADRPGVEPDELRNIVADHLSRVAGAAVADVNVDDVLDQLADIARRFPVGARVARVGDHVTEVRVVAGD